MRSVMTRLHIIKYMIIISLAIFPLTSRANATSEEAQNFIKNVSEQAIKVITDSSAGEKDKEKKLIGLFEKSVDTKWIAQFVMGKYWKAVNDKQKSRYMELHHKFLVNSYIPKFK